jgi:3-hydroxyacyl-CoA dehydrogenase
VIGAGVMGAGIAAHVANAGVPVVLLDIVPGGRAKAVERMLRADPAPFMHKSAARLVQAGDIEGGLPLLADCDWIVEAIVERPDAKRDLYARLEDVRKPGSIVSSNTSTIPLAALTQGLGEGFARDFLITHFFNPPRYMRLLELVRGRPRAPTPSRPSRRSATAGSARRSCIARTRRASSPTASAGCGCSPPSTTRWTSPDGGGGGRHHGQADGRA